MKNICVIGLGYIGLPTAAMLATHGCQVIGVDVNTAILQAFAQGKIIIEEPGLLEALQAAIHQGTITVSSAVEPADAFMIAVPTPIFDDKTADMRFVVSAAESIVPHLRKGNLVILESTSPPRTTVDLVQPILERSGLKAGQDFLLAYSPERVLPGRILRELVDNARVIGGITPESSRAGAALYRSFVQGEIIETDATTAEMVKLMENTYRDINIAIANEFSRLADRFGVDVWEAISIANLHPRVKILNPGPGVGGHCISVDPWFFVEAAPDLAKLIHAARQVNDTQPHFVVDVLERHLDGIEHRAITVLGLTFKANVDDVRESPAVEIVHILKAKGAIVKAYDPHVLKPIAGLEGLVYSSLEQALSEAHAVLLLVDHQAFADLNPQRVRELIAGNLVYDVRHVLNRAAWQAAGFDVILLGDSKSKN